MKTCKCGIAAVDCEYHRPEPESEMLTKQALDLFAIERMPGESDDALRLRCAVKVALAATQRSIRPPRL